MNTSEKIKHLIECGAKPHRVATATNTPSNTVRRAFTGETDVASIRLETAEKIASYYDQVELNLAEAIGIIGFVASQVVEEERFAWSYPEIYSQLNKQPFKVYTKLNNMICEPFYKRKLVNYKDLLLEADARLALIEPTLIEKVKLSDRAIILVSRMRHRLSNNNE